MSNEQLYEAIFRRKSVRKYDMAPLPDAALADLQQFARNAKPLDERIRYKLTYLGASDVRNLLPIKAPHYICFYSDPQGGYLMNAGYILQQVDLYLSAQGLGSCWLGMAKPSRQVPQQEDGLEFVIMLAFGQGSEPVHRSNASQFNRHSLPEITSIVGADELLEPVRLAPSASNTQAWFFSGTVAEVVVSRKQLNPIKAVLYGKMNQIDIGIALCHLHLSFCHQGKQIAFDFSPGAAPNGFEFMARATVTGQLYSSLSTP